MSRDLGSKTLSQASRVDHVLIDIAPDGSFNITLQRVREVRDADKLVSEIRGASQSLAAEDFPDLQSELVSILAKLAQLSDDRESAKEAEVEAAVSAAAEAALSVKQ